MSTFLFEHPSFVMNSDNFVETKSSMPELDWGDEMAGGQDASYILRKKALILDLWNLPSPKTLAQNSKQQDIPVNGIIPVADPSFSTKDIMLTKEWFPPMQ